jgi:hypothetical protein
LADHFGGAGEYTDGDFDKSGTVAFPDFVILADNFGRGAAASVPEPAFSVMGLLTTLLVFANTRRDRSLATRWCEKNDV